MQIDPGGKPGVVVGFMRNNGNSEHARSNDRRNRHKAPLGKDQTGTNACQYAQGLRYTDQKTKHIADIAQRNIAPQLAGTDSSELNAPLCQKPRLNAPP